MTDDKGLVDAYSSIYKKEEGQLDEALPLIPIAAKAAMAVAKGGKVAGALGKAANIAGKVSQVADAAGAVGDAANKIRGKGQKHPDNQQEEVEPVMENPALAAAGKAVLAGAAMEAGSSVAKKLLNKKKKEVKKEEVEGGVSVVDYESEYTPTEIETVDIIDAPKMKGTEDLHEDEEALEERLWDQVAANLTTLGEMRGVKYQVSPFEQEIEETVEEIEEHHQQDAEGKVIEHEEEEVQSEGFNVRSPLTFSKKEEPEVDVSELEEKYACSTKKAHKRLKK
tara:strand:- start:162 stop:1004 length:843 start_codon:yes stop_codon:yes gene_type:complete